MSKSLAKLHKERDILVPIGSALRGGILGKITKLKFINFIALCGEHNNTKSNNRAVD
jgi:hypothetical protein